MSAAHSSLYSLLPSVTEVDQYLKERRQRFGKPVRAHVLQTLQQLREQIARSAESEEEFTFFSGKEEILKHLAEQLAQQGQTSIRRVVNATGVVIHTNLGRSPVSHQLIESILPLLSSYSSIEYDLKTGKRGSRGEGIKQHLRMLSGAEDAVVVNNNAAAVYLMLMALASGKEVIVSRGELIEIGGSFRVPDIMNAAGVKLIEVGTTNRTRISDYENAISDKTAALLKVHPSNYKIAGFVEETSISQIANLAKQHQLLSFYDLGSGNFFRFSQPALQSIPSVQQELRSGVDLLTFSGDKLLGSTQAGIVVGKEELTRKLARHPLYRALRLDKVTMALLEVHLAAYFQIETLPETIPAIGMLEQSQSKIQKKAEKVFKSLKIPANSGWTCNLQATTSLTGGGALPELYLDSYSLILHHESKSAAQIQEFLRLREIPIIARIQRNQVCLDFRAIFPKDFPQITESLHQLFDAS
ncbi:MAG: L-seryl-tRNA(Sec) selenium transferase [SAR324 cluster bacterium]|nr:L-seryl-tRNA(Sec) selenium transferase [SAR324 cluster bacterium]